MRMYRCDICSDEYDAGGRVSFEPHVRQVGGSLVWTDGTTAQWPLRLEGADLCPTCAAVAAEALAERYDADD